MTAEDGKVESGGQQYQWHLLSPRLAFMQIHEAAIGKQLRIHANVVCVPSDVCTTVNNLPRTSSDLETVAIQLKRRSQYQHAFLTSNVRPECIRQVGTYLVDNGELFKHENISFSNQLLQSIQATENSNISQTSDNTQQLPVTQSGDTAWSATVTSESSYAVEKHDEVNSWSEIQDTEIERAGIFDTMFTSADFVEDSERAAVYGHIDSGHCDQVYSFAPAEGNRPISIFLDTNSEELSYPNIFGVMLMLKVTQSKFITAVL